MRRVCTWAAVISVLTVLLLAAGGRPTVVQADHPLLLLPAPAGSEWSIVAGYNTATHTGDDPYAIDLVREDAPTAGALVLAPLAGTVSWVSEQCLTIDDQHGMAILFCHLFPAPDVAPGLAIAAGRLIGEVAPAGLAGNGGLAHLHLAVHRTSGSGRLQDTIPFTGGYALEGRDLPPTNASNAYAGERFRSTNQPGREPPVPADPAEPTEQEPPVDPADAPPADAPRFLRLGWNLVGWSGLTDVEDATAPIAASIDAVFTFDAGRQQFSRYAPGAPPVSNTLTTLKTGQGVLVHVTAPDGVLWAVPPVPEPRPLPLVAGFNLVTWTGGQQSVADAMSGLEQVLIAAYSFDADSQRYRIYRPHAPAVLSDLETLETGQALWVRVQDAALWAADEGPSSTEDEPPQDEPPQDEPAPGAAPAYVLGPGCLNIRPAPTTVDAPPLACLAQGTAVELTGQTAHDANGDEWLFVHAAGHTGWVFAAYIVTGPGAGVAEGTATFVYPGLHGNPMSCGGAYDRFDPTIAAATSWPCGTRLRVSRGDRTVDIVVRDTGLLPPNHVDLSEAAFLQLGDLAEGQLRVRIEVLPIADDG